jgi:hypothetical protein
MFGRRVVGHQSLKLFVAIAPDCINSLPKEHTWCATIAKRTLSLGGEPGVIMKEVRRADSLQV